MSNTTLSTRYTHFLLLAIALLPTLMLHSCESIQSHKPDIIAVSGELPLPKSDIHLPLMLEISELEDLINEKIQGEIYNDPSLEGDNVRLSVSKTGRVKLNMQRNLLYYEVPLHIWIEGQLQKKLFGKKRNIKKQELDFSLTLRFCSRLNIDQNWRPVVKTELLEYKWVKKPKVKVGIFKVGVAKIVENQLEKRMDGLLEKIDASVHQKLDIKPMVRKIWTGIQKPVLINKKIEKIWLKPTPERLFMSHINGHKGYIKLNIRLQASFTTVLGDSPRVAINEQLPMLESHEDTSSNFTLYAKSSLPFQTINRGLNEQVGTQTIDIKGYSVALKDFAIMGSDSQLVVKVGVDSQVSGDIYLKGKPSYDSLSGNLEISDFDFDVSSETALVNTANWIMHDELVSKIGGELKLPLRNKLESLPIVIQNAIDKSKLSKKADIQLSNLRLEPQQILVTEKDLQLLMKATGNIRMELEHLQ